MTEARDCNQGEISAVAKHSRRKTLLASEVRKVDKSFFGGKLYENLTKQGWQKILYSKVVKKTTYLHTTHYLQTNVIVFL